MSFKLVFVLLLASFAVIGQDTLTLDECLRRAENSRYSLILETSELKSAGVNQRFHKYSLLPDLGLSSSFGAGFGRVLDPVSNQFSSNQVNSHSMGINSNVTIFKGFNYLKEKERLEHVETQLEIRRDQSLNKLYSEIIPVYFQLCLLQAQIKQSNQRRTHFENLIAIQRELFKAGKITEVDTLRSQNLLLKENSERDRIDEAIQKAQLRLNLMTGSNLDDQYICDASTVLEDKRYVYQDELFQMKANLIAIELLSVEEKLAQSSILPSLVVNGALGTRYSTSLKESPFAVWSAPMSYRNQLDLNVYQSVNFQLNIPIFNRGAYLKNRQIRRIKEDQLSSQQELLELNMTAKKKEIQIEYESKLRQFEQLEVSVSNLEKIYNASMNAYKAGKITFSELQDVFLEWQAEILVRESASFDVIRVNLMRVE